LTATKTGLSPFAVAEATPTPPAGPFGDPLAGVDAEAPPADLDDDGKVEDISGDGQANFDNAIALAFAQPGALTDEQRDAVDINDDGESGFDDAIELAFEV
jgi:hypothetical protein